MAGNQAIADSLLVLYLAGTKTAGSGLVRDYEHAGDPLPCPGEYWIILDSSKQPKCIVETIRVEFFTFADVPEHVAIAEGEGDLSIAYWTKAHEAFFTPFLAKLGVTDLSREQVVAEFFDLVYPQP